MLYFDHNATSPLCAVARDAWLAACERYPANPSSPHRAGGRTEAALNEARRQIAASLGCSPLDLVFTSGATEANNAIFHHAAGESVNSGEEAWVSASEHPSVLQAAAKYFRGRVRNIPVSSAGVAELDWLADQLKKKRPAIVALMAANNETGVLQPWEAAQKLCAGFEVPFACDAAQWVGKLPSSGLGACDFVTGCAHKFGGPLGAGFLKAPPGFRPLLAGGPQEDGRRAGTENVPAILSMAAAWNARETEMAADGIKIRTGFRDQFISRLAGAGIEIVGGIAPRLWNTVAALMPEQNDCRRRWVVKLDKRGFAVSTGSACSSGKEKPSHVLLAMGVDPAAAGRMLRFSAGWETTAADWNALEDAIQEEIQSS